MSQCSLVDTNVSGFFQNCFLPLRCSSIGFSRSVSSQKGAFFRVSTPSKPGYGIFYWLCMKRGFKKDELCSLSFVNHHHLLLHHHHLLLHHHLHVLHQHPSLREPTNLIRKPSLPQVKNQQLNFTSTHFIPYPEKGYFNFPKDVHFFLIVQSILGPKQPPKIATSLEGYPKKI